MQGRRAQSGRSVAALWRRGFVLLLSLVFFAQLACGSVHLSLTSDEPPHFVHGYTMLTTGDTWALAEHRHPPLLNVWGAWPLLLQPERPEPRAVPAWGTDFVLYVRALWPQLGPVERLAFVTRYPQMLLGLLLLALVYRWARERAGCVGGLLAVAVMAFDPTMIAHAQLNTTDIGMTLFAFACLYLTLKRSRGIAWLRLVGIGVTLGATLAAKGSGVLLAPVVGIVLLWEAWEMANGEWQMANGEWQMANSTVGVQNLKSKIQNAARHFLLSGLVVLIVSFVVLWGSYGFRLEPLPGSTLRLPLVAHVQMTRVIMAESARTAFLWGEVREGGWWWYFPAAFLLKTPIPILLLLPGSLLVSASKIRNLKSKIDNPKSRIGNLLFWFFPVLYVAVSIRSGMNIGYRHLLPVFPFLYVGIGAQMANSKWRMANGISRNTPHASRLPPYSLLFTPYSLLFTSYSLLLIWLIIGTLHVYPFAIAYFNELAGGPRNGYRYLVDSNVDWGQSFKALKTWMDETGTDEVGLSYYTWVDPAVYGVRYRPLPPAQGAGPLFAQRFDPAPGVYAISATPLQGVMVVERDLYDWFRHREPVAQPGYGLLVYDVAPRAAEPQWLAQCAAPVAPLTTEAIVDGFGRGDLRVISFDCTQSWLYPGGGSAPGWYALHGEMVRSDDAFVRAQLSGARLSYEQRRPGALPPFALYEQPAGALLAGPDDAPVAFGALTFLRYTVAESQALSPGTSFDIETWWRVEAVPERPLSLMLHLVGPGGQPVIVGDGLGVPRELWQVGDVLVQRHALPIPPDAPGGAYMPHVGVYWLDTMERWTVRAGSQTGQDHIVLPAMMIK
ncbi:MAG: glycosyltransferase family 39 protein [Anaerolineae bacterium]